MASRMFIVCGLIFLLSLFDFCATKDVANDEDKMGMEALYEMVHFFLGDMVQPKNISESFLNLSTVFVNDNFDNDQLEDWEKWADYAKGYGAGVAFGLLFIVVMPITGLFFCCCRLCGKCGGKPRKHDTRRSKCKRRTYCTLIIIFNTLALAGVICAFMCSKLIHKTLKNDNNEGTFGHIKESLTSIKNFTDGAVSNVSSTVQTEFNAVEERAIRNINDTGSKAVDNVLAKLNATRHLNKARQISKNVTTTKMHLEEVSTLLGSMSSKSNELKDNLTSIGNEINNICGSSCGTNFKPEDYTTDADFSKLEKLDNETKKVAESMNMSQFISKAEDNIEDAKTETRSSIQNTIKNAQESFAEVQKEIKDGIDDLTKQKDDAMSFYPSAIKDLTDYDKDVRDNSDLVFYCCIGVSCVYLLIVILYYMGIVFGLCGERPGHDAPCCNRGIGSNFLMAGVAFTFIFSWILMLLCTILFIIGGLSYTEVCRYFHGHDPNNFKVFDDTLNRGFDLSKTLFDDPSVKFSLSKSMRDCQENKALYSAFKMDHIFNLDEKINTKKLKEELDKFKNDNIVIQPVTILTDDLKKSLQDFADAGLNKIDFNTYYNELGKAITKVPLDQLKQQVVDLANNQNDPKKTQLLEQAERLEKLKEDVKDLEDSKDPLRTKLEEIQKGSNISDSINSLISDLEKSQLEFNTNSDTLVREQINHVADEILVDTNNSVDGLKNTIRTKIARCQPLTDSIYSVSDSVCVLLIDPLNGLWFSFGWCLFFFLLCLIFGVLLAGEYRHEYKYGKEFDDPFDSRNHDMMPLTSHPNVERPPGQDPMRYQQQQHPYQQPIGMHNSAYSPDMKHSHHPSAPPPYGQHMQPGIAAYASSPPPEYNGHRHHDLASAYPALSRGGGDHYMAGGSNKNSYSYPY